MILSLICEARQLEPRTSIKEFIRSDNVQQMFLKGLAILTPINSLITKFQGDYVPLSEVLKGFKDLIQHFRDITGEGALTQEEGLYVEERILNYESFTISKAHRLAYLLDPRYIGAAFTQQESDEIEELICMQPVSNVPTIRDSERYINLSTELGCLTLHYVCI